MLTYLNLFIILLTSFASNIPLSNPQIRLEKPKKMAKKSIQSFRVEINKRLS